MPPKRKDLDKVLALSSEEKLNHIVRKLEQLDVLSASIDQLNLSVGTIRNDIQQLETRVDRLDEICGASFPPELSIIASDIPKSRNENLVDKFNIMAREGLKLEGIEAVAAERLPSTRYKGTRPPLVKIELKCLSDKIKVLQEKQVLKANDVYKDVFLKSSQSHTERLLELNLATVLKHIPNGKDFRFTGSGRLVKKNDQRTQDNDNNAAGNGDVDN